MGSVVKAFCPLSENVRCSSSVRGSNQYHTLSNRWSTNTSWISRTDSSPASGSSKSQIYWFTFDGGGCIRVVNDDSSCKELCQLTASLTLPHEWTPFVSVKDIHNLDEVQRNNVFEKDYITFVYFSLTFSFHKIWIPIWKGQERSFRRPKYGQENNIYNDYITFEHFPWSLYFRRWLLLQKVLGSLS